MLELAEEATADLPAIVALLDGPLEGAPGLANARVIAGGFFDLGDAHHAVLRVRNHGADEGARAFRRAWRSALRPLLDALARRLGGGARAAGRSGFHPYAAAAALATVLESASAHHRELESFGASREELVETSARMIVDAVALAQETRRRRGG